MSNKKGVILITIFSISIILIYMLTRDDTDSKVKRLIIGDTIPTIQMQDIDGKEWNLDNLKGKVVLINFWATWCDTCKMEKPYFIKLIEEMRDKKDVVFLTVLYNDDKQKAIEYMKKNNYNFPVLIDSMRFANIFGVVGVPETVVLDKKSRYTQKITGPVKWDSKEIKDAIISLASK
ncbi:MAG: TlpA family protein disulfide reductase [Thermodesulfovibrionales bacterium]|nr:TlpA family protein disulfide reductase [Thermodesulfovibrionales bacterium]